MRTKTATFFECKVRYGKTMDNGMEKKVTETYAVDALSFSEAEGRIIDEMKSYIGENDMAVSAIKIAPYKEAIFSDADTDDKYYKVRCDFIIIDECSGKEKKSPVYYLVQAASVDGARKITDEVMGKTMIDYVIVSVVETPIIDVYEHE